MKIMNELRLSAQIYSADRIREAIGAFAGLCSMSLSSSDGAYAVSFSDCVYDTDETIKEFENYLIELTHGSMTG